MSVVERAMVRTRWVSMVMCLALALAGCDDEDGGGSDTDGGGGGGMCMDFEFEYAGEPEDGVCPRLECCPGELDGNFSAFSSGMCLSSANCEAVCADPDAAFDCL